MPSKNRRKLDTILLVLALFMLGFVVCMIWLFYKYQAIPDTLCTCVLGGSAVELVCTTAIKLFDKKEDNNGSDNG